MKKDKKAQFYFLAVIVFLTVFLLFISVTNKASYTPVSKLSGEGEKIDIEISYLFDYLSREQIDDANAEEILLNFSNYYIENNGADKEMFFLFGKGGSLKLNSYKNEGTSLFVDPGSGEDEITENGKFEKNYVLSGSFVIMVLDGTKYNFTFYEGENLYYLIKTSYNDQVFVESGGTSSLNEGS